MEGRLFNQALKCKSSFWEPQVQVKEGFLTSLGPNGSGERLGREGDRGIEVTICRVMSRDCSWVVKEFTRESEKKKRVLLDTLKGERAESKRDNCAVVSGS